MTRPHAGVGGVQTVLSQGLLTSAESKERRLSNSNPSQSFGMLLSVLVGGSLACAPASPRGASVKIGVLLPYTGEAAALSANLEKGSLLAVSEMNRAGGVGGLPVEIRFGNTFSDPERAVQAAEDLIDHGVVAVVGPGGDEVAAPVFASFLAAGIPLVSPLESITTEGVGSATEPWFRMTPTTKVLGENLAKLVRDEGTARVGAVVANDLYHSELGAAFSDRFGRDGAVDLLITVDEGAADFESLAAQLYASLEAGTEGVMLAMHPRPAARLAMGLAALRGAKGPPRWYLTPRLKTDIFLLNASAGAIGNAVGIAPEVFGGTRSVFEQRFMEASGDLPLDPAFFVYDATAVLLIALDRAAQQGGAPLPFGTAEAIVNVASFGGVLIPWDKFEEARQLNLEGRKMQYTGLTGPVILARDGARIIGTSSVWEVFDQRIVDRL